ncbi:YdhK family protein [Virgibacillus sp. C22-A2]|uniref:YdhK family protein n=1 Tax=Virgibacillus tibetensis TaxID=3042313 RepID=A0ABU6KHK9_9BACI|nr:YdhK family protein [Virgibacillus sp. C22-A2]
MNRKKFWLGFVLFIAALLLGACGGDSENETDPKNEETQEDTSMETEPDSDHSNEDMHEHMSSSGEVPEDLQEAENPTYEVGSTAIIEVKHMDMESMDGAEATIAGAYDTTAYSVSFTPTTGGEPVEDHKWVIHEELEDPGEAPLEPGTEVTMEASHMEGMEGATAVIDSSEETTVYMVDFTPESGGEEIKNHKWVIENELAPSE